jgi:DNA polymerase-3 subunit delta'
MITPLHHNLTLRQLESARQDAAGGYVFHGIRSVGKALAARELARQLNCRGDEVRLCSACRQFEAGSYPDFIEIRPESRPSITIEQVRQVNHALSLSPYYAEGVRLVMIDDAHALTAEAQNALLKLIEEPPPRTMFVLVAEHLEALLPTVLSRLAPVYFAPVPTPAIADFLTATHEVAPDQARAAAELAAGAPGLAIQLVQDPAIAETFAQLDESAHQALTAGTFDRLVLAKRLTDAKADLAVLAQRLQRALVGQLHDAAVAPERTAHSLVALEQFRRAVAGNVGPRVALERLMLEL